MSNLYLAEELHKTIIIKLQKHNIYSTFKDYIQGTDLADNRLISKYDKRFRFLLCVTGIYSKYELVVFLKNVAFEITNFFQKF